MLLGTVWWGWHRGKLQRVGASAPDEMSERRATGTLRIGTATLRSRGKKKKGKKKERR